jgi:hypothetical protein
MLVIHCFRSVPAVPAAHYRHLVAEKRASLYNLRHTTAADELHHHMWVLSRLLQGLCKPCLLAGVLQWCTVLLGGVQYF